MSENGSTDSDRTIAWPIRKNGSLGNWRVSPPTLRTLIAKGYVKLGGYDEKRKTWTVLYLGKRPQQQIESGVIKIVGRDPVTNVVTIFWKSKKNEHDDPLLAKLQLFQIVNDRNAWNKLQEVSKARIGDLLKKYNDKIEELPSSRREEYRKVKGQAREPVADHVTLPGDGEIEVREERPLQEKHLYIEEKSRKFGAKFNKWETKVLNEELRRKDVVGWFRNVPRKSWAFCVPYEVHGTHRPFYPDFILFRKEKNKIVADILDPHESGLRDSVDKAKGLAKYAREHGSKFGRIELIIVGDDDHIRRLDLTKESIRQNVLKVSGVDHLELLYEES